VIANEMGYAEKLERAIGVETKGREDINRM
jgi:hypothetical protein